MLKIRAVLISVMAAIAVVVVAAGVAVALLPPGGTFTDDNGNTHEGNIEAIAAAGVTKGCNPPTNDKYCPAGTVTRGQMAAFLARALDLPAAATDFFTDDDGTTFENDINRMAAAGITKGCNPPDNTNYCPDATVRREVMAAFLVRAFGYTDDGGGDLFTDDDNSIFEADIDKLATAGVTKGCNPPANTEFCPTQNVKRDQMASFLARALGLDPIVPPPPTTTTTLAPPVTFGAGTYTVGDDIPPDTYRNGGFTDGCYWERLSGFSGSLDDIIANNFDDVRQIVTIEATDKGFSSDSQCGVWSNDLSPSKSPTASFDGGTWQVNSEVAAGTWRNQPTDEGCYWERVSGFSGEGKDRIANDFIFDPVQSLVTILSTDVGFYADEACGTWTYLGP